MNNPYWERICKLSEAQRKKGMETYGQGLESNPAAMLKRRVARRAVNYGRKRLSFKVY